MPSSFVVGQLAVHHLAANELGVLPDLLRDRIIRRELDQAAGDDFRFGVALLVAEPIEFVDQLGDLLLHLELHFAIAVDARRARLRFACRGRSRHRDP